MMLFAMLLATVTPTQSAAAPVSPSTTSAVEPARLAASNRFVAIMFPPSQRDKMMRGMIEPMMANMRNGLEQSPQLATLFAHESHAKAIFLDFIDQQTKTSLDQIEAAMPGLMDAIAKAYARRFNVVQLDELTAFYRTPTGQAFISQMSTLMSDPDIAAVQGAMMQRAMAQTQRALPVLVQKLASLKQKQGK